MAIYRYRYRDGSVAARAVSAIFGFIAFLLALHIAFVLLEANTGNPIVHFVKQVADFLAYLFKDIFTLDDGKLQALLNYGIAALVFLVIGGMIGGAIDRRTHD